MSRLLIIFLFLSVLSSGRYVCNGNGCNSVGFCTDTLYTDDDPWIRTEFIPSKFTNDRKIQQELSKFIYPREWKSDCRELLLQTDEKRFEYFNFKDPEQRIAAFDFADDKIIFAVGEVINGEDIAGLKELTVEQIDTFETILIKCKLSGFPFQKSDDDEYEYYLCGVLPFEMNNNINGYIILNRTTYYIFGRPSYHYKAYLIIQDKNNVLSLLDLTGGFSGNGHAIRSRAIRVSDNLFVEQSELSNDMVIEATQEEAEEYGIKNHATFKVFEVTKDGYIVGRN